MLFILLSIIFLLQRGAEICATFTAVIDFLSWDGAFSLRSNMRLTRVSDGMDDSVLLLGLSV